MTLKLKVPGFIANDFFRKVVAIFFATLIWVYVKSQVDEVETYREIRISVEISDGVLYSVRENNLVVEVRGPRTILNELKNEDIVAKIKLEPSENITAGAKYYEVKKEDISFSKYGRLLKVASATGRVRIHRDVIETKFLEVQPVYSSELDEDKFDLKVSVIKEKRRVSGPSLLIGALRNLTTEPIVVERYRKTDYQKPVNIVAPSGVTLDYPKVTLDIKIRTKKSRLTLASMPVTVIYKGKQQVRTVSELPTVNLTIAGAPDSINSILRKDIRLFVEIPEGAASEDEYDVKFMTSKEGVFKEVIKPAKIKVKTEKIP